MVVVVVVFYGYKDQPGLINTEYSLKRPHYPLEGSSQLLKRLDRNQKYWAAMDFTQGYHQSALHTDDRDIFSIILP